MAVSENIKRKNQLFNELRLWAYQHVVAHKKASGTLTSWEAVVREKAYEMNRVASAPTKEKSLLSVALRVAEFSYNIYAMDRSSAEYRAMQSERGKLGAYMRWGSNEGTKKQAFNMRAEGLSVRKIAQALSVSHATVYAWLKSMPAPAPKPI